MKSTGIIRKIDELGRVVIPIEIRKNLDIKIKDPVEIYMEGNSIILKKFEEFCFICGKNKELKSLSGKKICTGCINKIKGDL